MWWYRSIKYGSSNVLIQTTQLFAYFLNNTKAMPVKRECLCGLLAVVGVTSGCGLLAVVGVTSGCGLLAVVGVTSGCGLLAVVGVTVRCGLLAVVGVAGGCGLLAVVGVTFWWWWCSLLAMVGVACRGADGTHSGYGIQP